MKIYTVSTPYGDEHIYIKEHRYVNGNLALQAYCAEDGTPYARLTVNLPDGVSVPHTALAYIDTNNCPWASDFLIKNGLGVPFGIFGYSGFCSYPLFEILLQKID